MQRESLIIQLITSEVLFNACSVFINMNEYFSLIKNLCTKTRVILLQTPVFRVHTNVETLVPSRPFSAKIGMIKDSSLNLWLNFYEYLLLKKKEISNIWVISETFISYIQYLKFGNIHQHNNYL